MDYEKHYYTLINKAKSRILEGYVEKHHIIPKCLGGTDDITNLVILTPEEHYVAHQLLVKMNPQNEKLILAVNMMCVKTPEQKRNNKRYGWLKRKLSNSRKGKPSPNKGKKSIKPRKPRAKETKPRKKRILTQEHKDNIGKSLSGRSKSIESKEKCRQSNIKTKSTIDQKLKSHLAGIKSWETRRKNITP